MVTVTRPSGVLVTVQAARAGELGMTVSATAAATPAAAALAAASTERRSRRDAAAGAAGGAVIRWYRLVAAGESGPARDVRRAGAASASVVSRSMSSSVPLDDRRN